MGSSWRIDAKWLFGFICLAAIIVAAVLYSASKLTERDAATSIFSSILISIAKDDDGAEEFEEFQALAVASPDEDFTIEGATLPIKGRELIGLSYDEAVELVVGRIAEILYTDGPESVEQFFTSAPDAGSEEAPAGEGEEVSLGPLGLLTQNSHDTVGRIFRFSLIPILVLAVLLVFFSRRFGRLGSPGVILTVGAAPFAALWFIVRQATKNAGPDGIEGALAEALAPMAGDVSTAFLRLLVLGVTLVLAAVAGHIGYALWHRFRPTPTPGEEETPPPDEPEQQPDYLADEGATASGGDEFPSIGPGGVPQA
jgi:hypothetical protein